MFERNMSLKVLLEKCSQVDCIYMYVQLHIHVVAIARTCICNEPGQSNGTKKAATSGDVAALVD